MEYQAFYSQLFKPLEADWGELDSDSIVAIIGFDAGGPLNFSTIGRSQKQQFVTYVSCELAVRDDQQVSEWGPYELMMTCNDDDWCRAILTDIGNMSLDVQFGHGHTLDIKPWVAEDFPLQGIAFELYKTVEVEQKTYAIFRCHGITREELEFAYLHGVDELLACFVQAEIYPNTDTTRRTVKLTVKNTDSNGGE